MDARGPPGLRQRCAGLHSKPQVGKRGAVHGAREHRLYEIADLIQLTLLNANVSEANVSVSTDRMCVLVRDISYWPDEFTAFLRSKHSVRVDLHAANFDEGGFVVRITPNSTSSTWLLILLCAVALVGFACLLAVQWHAFSEGVKQDSWPSGSDSAGGFAHAEPEDASAPGEDPTRPEFPLNTLLRVLAAQADGAGDEA